MTTTPSRIDKIYPTLCSILSQDRRVDEIRINVPYRSLKGEKYIIPDILYSLKNVTIHRVETDLGPSTKLLPSLLDETPDTRIIVIDDDMIYGQNFVKTLISFFEKHKGYDVITIYGSNVEDGQLTKTLNHWKGSGYVDRLYGCGGYVLTPSMLGPEIFEYDVGPREAVFVDDNWISGWLNLNKIGIYMLGMLKGCTFLPSISSLRTESLCMGINKSKNNDKIVDKWFIKRGAYK